MALFKICTEYVSGPEFFRSVDEMDELENFEAECCFNISWQLDNKQTIYHPEDVYDEDSLNHYPAHKIHMERNAYRKQYGSLSVKKFLELVGNCVINFKKACEIRNDERKFITKMWNLQNMYLMIDDSFPLLQARMPQLIVHTYDQLLRLYIEIRTYTLTAKMKKHADITVALMRKLEEKIIHHIADQIWLVILLAPESKMHFVNMASPEILLKIGRLQRRYWLSYPVVAVSAPKYYLAWSNFWTPFLYRNFVFGGDVCRHIAEYIPYKMVHSSFVEFFREHFYMHDFEYTTDRMPFNVEQTFSLIESHVDVYVSDVNVVLYNIFQD